MTRILGLVGAACMALAVLITPAAAKGVASQHVTAPAAKIGVVLDVGGVNDHSFNHLAYIGLQKAGLKLHSQNRYVVSRGPADYVPNLSLFASQHYTLVIGVGFLMASAMYTVAKQYPNTKFALIDSAPADPTGKNVNLPNVANLFFKEQESGYLVGVMAGLMEKQHIGKAKRNTIGWMGGISIPPVNRYIAGYIAGAKRVNPGIKIVSGYSQSFTDAGKGKEIGLAQISQGADILFQVAGSSGNGYLAAAQQQGKYGIGVDADEGYLGKYVMTSALKKVDAAVFLTAKSATNNTFRAGDHKFSLANNGTGYAKTAGYVPASIIAQVKKYAKLIKSGKITPPENIP
jgi:basic membrane protein A